MDDLKEFQEHAEGAGFKPIFIGFEDDSTCHYCGCYPCQCDEFYAQGVDRQMFPEDDDLED